MRKFSILLLTTLLGFSFSQAYAETKPLKDWTIAVFLNADNNLD